MQDPIVEEVRRARAEIAARNGNDLRRIFEDARSRQGSDGRRVVSYDPAHTKSAASQSDTGFPACGRIKTQAGKPVSHFCSMKPFDPEAGIAKSRRNLPHWEQAGCTYFVTWRLADSLPATKLAEWTESRECWLSLNPRPWSPTTAAEYNRAFVARIDGWLDAGHGSCVLRRPDVRGILAGALQFFHGQRYDLDACVIMPNHVHVLVTPYVTQAFQPVMETNPQAGKPVSHLISLSLSRIVQSWKGYSAREINRLLGRTGRLWMDENFDHAVRSEAQLEHFRRYIRENPAKARLRDDEYFLQSDSGFPACAEPDQQPGMAVPHSQCDTGFPACGSDTHIASEEAPMP